jgi:hypothetical protein
VDFAQDGGAQRMRYQPCRFAIADQNLGTHRVISIPEIRFACLKPSRHDYHPAAPDRSRKVFGAFEAARETFGTWRI